MELSDSLDSCLGHQIPSGWTLATVREIGNVKTGPFGTLLKASEYSIGDGTPLISVREIRNGYISVDDETPLVPDSVVRRMPEYVLRQGDIVFGRKGGVDRSALLKPGQEGWFLGSDGIRLRLSESYWPEYIAYQLQRSEVQAWLLQQCSGTIMATLSQSILNRLPILLPPLAEQRAIAAALSDVDTLVSALDALIDKKSAVRTAAMQQLLTGLQRLPGFSGEWTASRLGAVSSHIASGTSKPRPTGTFPVHGSTGTLGFDDEGAYSGNVILIARVGSVGTMNKASGRYGVTDNTIIVRLGESVSFDYIWFALDHANLKTLAFGSSQPLLTGTQLKAVRLNLPPLAEQTAIAAVLSDMDAEIAALEARRDKTRHIKTGMMQELLTGHTRLV